MRSAERQRRDEEFTDFVAASSRSLRRVAFLMVGDWYLADDVVQNALVGMYRRWTHLDRSYGVHAYARRAVVNAALGELRRPHRRESPVDELPDGQTAADAGGLLLDHPVAEALRALAPRQRAVVVLRYVEDLDVCRTAELLGISEGTVKSQSARGLATLRTRLAPYLEPAGSRPTTPSEQGAPR